MYKELYESLVNRSIIDASTGGDNITEIGLYAYNSCKSLVTASFPVATQVANYAFQDCSKLESVSIPMVTQIGFFAFQRNSALVSISADSLLSIGQSSFQDCVSLEYVAFPKLTSLGSAGAFSGDYNLKEAHFPSFNSYVGGDTFRQCTKLETLELGTVLIFYSAFTNMGNSVSPRVDADGNEYKTLVILDMTASNVMSTTGFPGNAPTSTKFECSDGYIVYDTSTSSWKSVTT